MTSTHEVVNRKYLDVQYVNYGIANRFENHIELHQALKQDKWKTLHDWILKHEREHHCGGVSLHDFLHDIKPMPFDIRKLQYKFIWQNPSSLVQLLPVWYDAKRNTLILDWNSIIIWTGSVIIAYLFFLLL